MNPIGFGLPGLAGMRVLRSKPAAGEFGQKPRW
jgi:hypothetical protein